MTTIIKKDFSNTPRRPTLNNTLVYDKVPPQAIEFEEAVLGACMLEKETFAKVQEIITSSECFYVDAHQKIYQAICDTYKSGVNVDLLTVTEQLRKSSELEIIGGVFYLNKLTSSIISSAHVNDHCYVIMEKFFKREVIRISAAAIGDAYEETIDVFDLLENVETEIKSVTAGLNNFEDTSLSSSYTEVVKRYERQKQTKTNLIGLNTGLYELNEMTGGLQVGLTLIGAYPSEGKTALMLELARKVESLNKTGRGKIYSLETESINLASRMAASENQISFELLQKGILDNLSEQRLFESSIKFARKKISFSTKIFFIEDIEKSARKHKKKYPDLAIIFIDFIQLIRLRNNTEKLDKYARVGHISSRLKQLSKELEVPIIALSQLNTDAKKNKGKRPELENLANSVELSQNADVVIFIWYKDGGSNQNPEPHLIVAKNKDGKTGEFPIKFDATYQTWSDYNENTPGDLPSIFTGYQTSGNGYNQNDWAD